MINEEFRPIREKRKYYEQHPEIVDEIIKKGDQKAREAADEVLKKVRQAVRMF